MKSIIVTESPEVYILWIIVFKINLAINIIVYEKYNCYEIFRNSHTLDHRL